MASKNKPNEKRPRPDTDVARNERSKDRQQTNNGKNTGAINEANTINTGYNQQTGDLHSKRSVTGSDADGQAE